MFLPVATWEEYSIWEVRFLGGLSNNDPNLLRLMVLWGGMILRICWGQYFHWGLFLWGDCNRSHWDLETSINQNDLCFFLFDLEWYDAGTGLGDLGRFMAWYFGNIFFCTKTSFQLAADHFPGFNRDLYNLYAAECPWVEYQGYSTTACVSWVEFRYLILHLGPQNQKQTYKHHCNTAPEKRWPYSEGLPLLTPDPLKPEIFYLFKTSHFWGISSLKLGGYASFNSICLIEVFQLSHFPHPQGI